MLVSNLYSSNNNKVANQFTIEHNGATYFQSYETVIARIVDKKLEVGAYDYSNTTAKYFRRWLVDEMGWHDSEVDRLKKELRKADKNGVDKFKFTLDGGYECDIVLVKGFLV